MSGLTEGVIVVRQYVTKLKTGAVWSTLGNGVWKKESYGSSIHPRTKPVGYVTTQFDPNSNRNRKRFIKGKHFV